MAEGWRVIVVQALSLALALSLAGNAALGWAWSGARDAKVQAVLERDAAQDAATACSDATDDLRDLADKRAKEAAPARAAAKLSSGKLAKRADRTLATQQVGTGCEGMQALGDGWLKERAK